MNRLKGLIMIDIHSHILFAVDDGAVDLVESMALIADSYQQGVRTIIVTPHKRKNMFEATNTQISENFSVLKHAIQQQYPDLKLYLGNEIYYTSDVFTKLKQKNYFTLAETNFVLVEFAYESTYQEIYTAIREILSLGLRPVLAHVERYDALALHKERFFELRELGCLIQINAASVLPAKLFNDPLKVFKKRTQFCLKANLVDFVASDVHHLDQRKNYLQAAYQQIQKKYGTQRAQDLFEMNQKKILLERD